MKTLISTFILSITTAVFSSSDLSFAQDAPKVPEKTSGETITKELPSAIKIGIADGIVRYINNDRRIKINLSWEPLPVTPSLITQSTKYNFSLVKLKLRNKDLKNSLETSKIPSLKELESSVELLNNGVISASEYVQMYRERNIISALLSGEGAQYSFNLKSDEFDLVPPDFSEDKIEWHINIYSFTNNDEGKYYRFTAKAVVDSFEVSVANRQEIFYDARFKLKESKYTSQITKNLFVSSDSMTLPNSDIDKSQGLANLPKSADLNKSLSSLSGFLSIVGGSEQLGALTEGFLGGTEDTSIISGGLIGNGGVSPLVGVNRELLRISDDTSGGLLLGLGLGDKNSLFLGPSIQSSIFTLSGGARIGTQSTDVSFAGMVAVDLSRITNSKKNRAAIPVKISAGGGGLGQTSDRIINKYTFLDYQVDRNYQLTRVCDEGNKKISEDNKKLKNILNLIKASKKKRIYIPRGIYQYIMLKEKVAYLDLTSDKLATFNPSSKQTENASDTNASDPCES